MTTSATPRKGTSSQNKKTEDEKRRVEDRREEDSKGYMHISMVGWICRREKSRRHPGRSG